MTEGENGTYVVTGAHRYKRKIRREFRIRIQFKLIVTPAARNRKFVV